MLTEFDCGTRITDAASYALKGKPLNSYKNYPD